MALPTPPKGLQGDVQDVPIGSRVVNGFKGRPLSEFAPSKNQPYVWNGTQWVPTTMTAAMVTNAADLSASALQTFSGPISAGAITSSAAVTGVSQRSTRGTIGYSASITPNCATGEWQTINATNGSAFTINAPANPPSSSQTMDFTLEIINSSGGALGAITWNAIYRPLSAGQPIGFSAPANTFRRAVFLRWNGNAWIITGATTADYS